MFIFFVQYKNMTMAMLKSQLWHCIGKAQKCNLLHKGKPSKCDSVNQIILNY